MIDPKQDHEQGKASGDTGDTGGGKDVSEEKKEHFQRTRTQLHLHPPTRRSFRRQMIASTKKSQFHDFAEKDQIILKGWDQSAVMDHEEYKVPSLRECQRLLHNDEFDVYVKKSKTTHHQVSNVFFNNVAAFIIYLAHTIGLETFLVLGNAVGVSYFFCAFVEHTAVKLDFSFLAFSVVFPLTFLIQTTFSRRDLALTRLADLKANILSTVLTTLSVDWPSKDDKSSLSGGRLDLPDDFNSIVVSDAMELITLVYQYLSMPAVAHARNLVFQRKKLTTKRVHALQNDILKCINDVVVDFFQHTEVMRKAGFPSGEASRIHQYHQYLQQRFEQVRVLKYYRTPQAARSFGRVYLFVLPWLSGPYYAWVYQESHLAIALVLAGFTYLILVGLLNAQAGLEDPFLADYTSWLPGVDTVKLDYELATVIQAINQYYAQAEILRQWELKGQRGGAPAEQS